MVLKITNLHILRYLPTCWLYLLERYTIDNQRCTHTASESKILHRDIINVCNQRQKHRLDFKRCFCLYHLLDATE